MSLITEFSAYFDVPTASESELYKAADQRARESLQLPSKTDDRFALEHARLRLQQAEESEKVLDQKSERQAKFGAAILAFIVLASKNDFISQNYWTLAAVIFLLLSVAYALRCQRPIQLCAIPRVGTVLEKRGQVNRNDWLAAAYHRTIEGNKVTSFWVRDLLHASYKLMLAGLVCLGISMAIQFV